jgi:hypothetical protein
MELDDKFDIVEPAPLILDDSDEVTAVNLKTLVIFILNIEEKEKENKE